MSAKCPVEPGSGSVTDFASPAAGAPGGRIYTRVFWAAYVANVIVVAANGLTFRFAELVGFVGGSEQIAGMIIGVSVGVALLSRLFLGQAIDQHGVRKLWIISSIVFVVGGAMLTLTTDLSWQIYAGRTLFALGLSGTLTCSTVFIQTIVPPERRTEIIASLGSSGFVGMVLGALLGDLIFLQFDGRARFLILFGGATVLGLLYIGFVLGVTRDVFHRAPATTPPLHHLLFRYWPGNVLLVAFVMGMTLAVTTVFLTRFATYHGMSGIGPFFVAYSCSAFAFRVASRGWSRTIGRHRLILMGLAGQVAAMFMLPFATTPLLFTIPALFGGFGHALIFPAVVSLGAEAFPDRFRGTGTTVVMGFFELGIVVSAPILGTIIDVFDGHGFTPMFLFAGVVAVVVLFIYAATTARTPDTDLLPANPTSGGLSAGNSRPIWTRHSPIEPAALSRAGVVDGDTSLPETAVVRRRPATGPSRRDERGAGVPPGTACR